MLASQTPIQANPLYQTQYQPNSIYSPNIGAQGVSPQGFDFGSIISTVAQGAAQALPGLLMSLLSADPQIQQQLTQQTGQQQVGRQGLQPQSAIPQQYGNVNPQGFDFGSIISTVAQGAAQALPGLLMSLLSSNPQIQQLSRQGINPQSQAGPHYGAQQGGVAPQGLFNFGVQTPFGGAGLSMFENTPQVGAQQWAQGQAQQYGNVSPQFNFGGILRSVAQRAAQALPGLLTQLLSADPQIQQLAQQAAQQTPQPTGVNPQSLFNFGLQTPFGGAGLSMFENTPQVGAQQWAQGQGQAQQYGNVNPQFNFGGILRSVAQRAAQALPGLLTQLLSADPQIQQLAHQQGGVTPQGLFNFGVQTPFGGAGLSMFENTPQAGIQQPAAQQWAGQQAGGVSAQGIDLRGLAQNLANILAPQLPGIVSTILNQTLGSQTGTPVTVH